MLKVDGVAAIRGDRLVFGPISFAVPPSGALLLTGPNGSGKSTLLRLLAGLGRAEAGHITWNGENVLADRTGQGGRVGYIGHQDAVKPGLTAAENLGREPQKALQAMGLQNLSDLPARMLSAGQKRRLALARLLLRPTPIWLLDEPTLGLDTASVAKFGTMLEAHRATGGVVIAATHLPLPLPNAAEFAFA